MCDNHSLTNTHDTSDPTTTVVQGETRELGQRVRRLEEVAREERKMMTTKRQIEEMEHKEKTAKPSRLVLGQLSLRAGADMEMRKWARNVALARCVISMRYWGERGGG